MNFSAKNFREVLLESPGWKTFFSVIIPVLTGVLSGAFIAELTINSVIQWRRFYTVPSFYGLIFVVILIYLYNRIIFLHAREVRQFSDDDFCRAYMRSKCLPEAANRYKELIRTGHGGELKLAMDELEKILR